MYSSTKYIKAQVCINPLLLGQELFFSEGKVSENLEVLDLKWCTFWHKYIQSQICICPLWLGLGQSAALILENNEKGVEAGHICAPSGTITETIQAHLHIKSHMWKGFAPRKFWKSRSQMVLFHAFWCSVLMKFISPPQISHWIWAKSLEWPILSQSSALIYFYLQIFKK